MELSGSKYLCASASFMSLHRSLVELRAAPRNPGVERTHGYATRAFHHLTEVAAQETGIASATGTQSSRSDWLSWSNSGDFKLLLFASRPFSL